MADRISFYQTVYNLFWGDDVFHWWFYLAALLIIIFSTNKIAKRIFAFYPLCFMLAVFSPIAHFFINRYAHGHSAYYARMFSMIPLPETLGFGTLLLIDWICSKFTKEDLVLERSNHKLREELSKVLKLLLVAGICAVICFGGTDVYTQDWMKPAQNRRKVPEDAIAVCKTIHHDNTVTTIAVPSELSHYIRQIDASIIMPYSGTLNSLGYALSEPYPNPDYVMEEAGREACDYIVVYANEENRIAFAEKGWSPTYDLGRFLVYFVENVPRIKTEYDEKHRPISITALDKDGNPEPMTEGYTSVKSEYDRFGNKIKESYYDENNESYMLPNGYAAISRSFFPYTNRMESVKYWGADGNLVCINGCYETRFGYNGHWPSTETYYDENGNPMIRKDKLYASKEYFRDYEGKVIKGLYYGLNGELVLSDDGYAGFERMWDNAGNIVSEFYLGLKEEKIMTPNGYAGFKREHDTAGNIIREVYVNEIGSPVCQNEGYAEIRREYNERNQITKITYWDEFGNPAVMPDGFVGEIREYDENGNLIDKIFLNAEETLPE